MQLEPLLQPLTGEELCERLAITTEEARCEVRSAITTDEARCEVSTEGFWSAGQVAFLDVRVFNSNVNRYVNQSLRKPTKSTRKKRKGHIMSEFRR